MYEGNIDNHCPLENVPVSLQRVGRRKPYNWPTLSRFDKKLRWCAVLWKILMTWIGGNCSSAPRSFLRSVADNVGAYKCLFYCCSILTWFVQRRFVLRKGSFMRAKMLEILRTLEVYFCISFKERYVSYYWQSVWNLFLVLFGILYFNSTFLYCGLIVIYSVAIFYSLDIQLKIVKCSENFWNVFFAMPANSCGQ